MVSARDFNLFLENLCNQTQRSGFLNFCLLEKDDRIGLQFKKMGD